MSNNKYVKLSDEFIEKFHHKWDWYELSSNENLPWAIELIEKFEDKWYWWSFRRNKSIPWCIKLIHKYSDKIERHKNIWEILCPFLDDEMVFNLLEEIKSK